MKEGELISVDTLVEEGLKPQISCICFFGGDGGGPQAIYTLNVAKKLLETVDYPLRVSWETNGLWNKNTIEKAHSYALKSGGNIKFDLKFPEKSPLSEIISGVKNKQSYTNFKLLASNKNKNTLSQLHSICGTKNYPT